MRRGLQNVSLFGLVFALVLLLGMQVGWISPPAFLGGNAQDVSPDSAIEEPTDPRAVHPTLRGRPPSDVLEDDWDVLPSPVDLDAVDREHDLHGIVVRQDDTPVAGASVQVLTHPWRHQDLLMDHGLWDVTSGPLTRSAADGTFRLGLERGEPVALYVRAKGLAPVELHLLQAGERIRVVLQESARLRVVVRGPEGEPVEGTSIRLFHRGGKGREARGLTDAEGVLLLAELEPDRRGWIDVTPPVFGYPGWVEVETPAAGEETTVEVDLVEGRTLRGRVTDAKTGEGIAEARVGMNWVLRPEVKTNPDGTYELGGWTGIGVRDIHVLAEGYAREAKVVAAENEIDFVLLPVPPIVGRVVDEGGRAVEGARVHAIGTARGAGGSKLSVDDTQTGEDGRFRLTGLTPGLPHMLVVVALGYGRTWQAFAVHGGQEEDVLDLGDVVLPAGLSLSGVVVDAEDVPLARTALELIHGEEEFRSTRGATLDRVTDDLGRFFFHDLSPGTYTLRVKPAGGVEASRVFVLEDGDLSDVRVTIAADVEIVVLVVNESGTPVPGARVSFMGTGRRHAQAQSDADGRAVAKLPADRVGEYTVTVRTFDRSDLLPGAPRSLRAEEREIEVVLRTALTIRGRLLTEEGEPVPTVPMSARRGDQIVTWTRTRDDGAFTFVLEAGPPVDLVFDGRMSGNLETRWRAFEGREEGIPVGADDVLVTARAVAADRTIEVRVLDPDGNPAAGVMVLNPGSMNVGAAPARTDETGTCRFEGLRDEEIRLRVLHTFTEEAPWAAPPEIAVVPEGQSLVVHLRRARMLEGRVTWAAATAPVWVTIRLQRADGTLVSEGGGRDGAFRVAVPLDEKGPLVLRAEGRAPDGSTMVGRRAVPPPEATDVTVELRAP